MDGGSGPEAARWRLLAMATDRMGARWTRRGGKMDGRPGGILGVSARSVRNDTVTKYVARTRAPELTESAQ